ncbi:MAG: efflux RND transporter periplasmic adaptor subunit [Eubacteriales bacterium]|nr:efflux RND transporter periplasmic adaptor subunit [Eubacteriales bacterium]
MRKGLVIGGVVVVAAAAAIILPRTVFKKEAPVQETVLPVVQVERPQNGTIELYRDLVGKVEPSDVVYIYPKMAGEVTQVFVKAGDVVKEGQAICTIDTKQVEGARLNLEAAEQTLKDAQTNLSRQQALFNAGDIASAVWEQAQTQAKNAQINYDSAKLNYDNQVEYANITATIGGKVEACDIEVHDNVSGQVLLAVISGEGSKSVAFSVPEKIEKQLSAGDTITIEKNGSEYTGTINEISSMIDATTGLFKVKASVEDGDAIPTGSSVKLYVTAEKAENVMTIPVDAVYYSGGDAYVYTCEDGTVHQTDVEVGIYDSERAQILSGITMDDQVITTWSSELYEGSRVQTADGQAE